jgi:hypothetical protein
MVAREVQVSARGGLGGGGGGQAGEAGQRDGGYGHRGGCGTERAGGGPGPVRAH